MAFPEVPTKWKEWYGSGTFPELLEMFQKQLESKRQSRLIIKKHEIKWDSRHPMARAASVIDPRLGFSNSICNVGLSEIAPGGRTGKHKHAEAYVYMLEGRGYSLIGDKKVEWEAGDGIYIPPDTFHQHFNLDKEKPARFLRVVPGPIVMNLISLLTAANVFPPYSMEVAETHSEYRGEGEEVKAHFRGKPARSERD